MNRNGSVRGILGTGLAVLLCLGPVSYAQEEVPAGQAAEPATPLESVLENMAREEVAQAQTPAPAQEAAAQAEPPLTAQPVSSPEGEDALPPSTPQEVRIRAQGFDLSAEDSVTVNVGGDPSQASRAEQEESIRREAYDAAVTGLFPLRPAEIEGLLKHYDETRRAVETPPYDLPEPEVSVQTISLDPGVVPPVIKTAVGHVTTVNMLDITGAPWPIQDVTWAGDFEVIEPEEGGHVIRITPMSHFTYGNMSIRLLTLKTPVTLSLRTERDSVHFRVDARIPEFGPMAETPLIEGGTAIVAGDAVLTSVLDGTPPSGSQKLAVGGVDGRTTAYRIGGLTYVRTPLTLLSPGWDSSVSSADGMHVYALTDTPVLLLSDEGRFMRAQLSEERDLFDE